MRVVVFVFPLCVGQPAMFRRSFEREFEALAYVDFWMELGSCRIEVK